MLVLVLIVVLAFVLRAEQGVPTAKDFRSAVINSRVAEVEELLRRDPSLSTTKFGDESALHDAVRAPSPRLLEALLPHFNDVNPHRKGGYSPLHIAVSLGRPKYVQLLLQHGADPNSSGPTDIGGKYCESPVAVAAMMCSHECLRVLLDAGGHADGPDNPMAVNTPAILACDPMQSDRQLRVSNNAGNVAILTVLQDAGADLHKADAEGTTPLWEAVCELRPDIVDVLISLEVDVNQVHPRRNATVLHALAGSQARIELETEDQKSAAIKIARLILNAGGDMSIRGYRSMTVNESAKYNKREWLFEAASKTEVIISEP